MINIEAAAGTSVKLYFDGPSNITSFVDTLVMRGAVVVTSPVLVINEIGNGLYSADYTPSATGTHCVFINGKVIARIEVVQKTSHTLLKNIEDEAMGSWSWDKQAGTLVMTRQDGTTLATFDVTETLEIATRERT